MDELAAIEKPGKYDFCITRGDSLRKVFTMQTEAGVRIPLTGLSGTATVRDAPDGTVLLTIAVAVDQSPADQSTTGDVTVTAPGDDTDSVLAGVWELILDDGSLTGVFRKTVVAGTFQTVPK